MLLPSVLVTEHEVHDRLKIFQYQIPVSLFYSGFNDLRVVRKNLGAFSAFAFGKTWNTNWKHRYIVQYTLHFMLFLHPMKLP